MAIGATTVLGKDTERKAGDSDKATSSIRFNSLDGSNLVDSRWCVTFRKRTAGGGKRKKKKRREWTTIGLSRDPIDHSPRSDCIPQLDSQSSDHAAALGLEKLVSWAVVVSSWHRSIHFSEIQTGWRCRSCRLPIVSRWNALEIQPDESDTDYHLQQQ